MRLPYYHTVSYAVHPADRTMGRCLGESLITLLISLSLMAMIVTGACQWYQTLRKIMITQQHKAQHLEIGRTVLQYIVNDLKSAGYRGCRTLDAQFPIYANFVNRMDYRYFQKENKVFGLQITGNSCPRALPQSICERLISNADILIVQHVPGEIYFLKQAMRQPNEALYIEKSKPFLAGAMVLISDCQQGDLFIASQVEENRVFHEMGVKANLSDQLSKNYAKDAEVVELKAIAYYLGIPERHRGKPRKTYSLFRSDLLFKTEEVLEGIVDFQVAYGIWQPKIGIRYMPASNLSELDWPKVTGVFLKIKTENNHVWEYQIAAPNRQRIYFGFDIAQRDFTVVSAYHAAKRIVH